MTNSVADNRTPHVLRVIQRFWQDIGRQKSYWMPLLFLSILSYAYSVTHETLSIDDLRRDFYLGSQAEKLAGRWGMILWTRLAASGRHAAFIDKYFSAVFMVLAAVCFAALLHRIGKSKPWAYTVFSCAFVSYPLINEIWEYTVTDFMIFGNLFLSAIILIHLYGHDYAPLLAVLRDRQKPSSAKLLSVLRVYLVPVLLMSLIASSYESGVTFYITAVMVILFYRYCVTEHARPAGESSWRWVFRGLHFAVPVAFGIVLSSVIGRIVRAVYHLTAYETGDNTIRWGETTVWGLFKLLLTNYVAKALLYLPVAVYLVLTIVFATYCLYRCFHDRRILPLLLGKLTALSLFMLTFVQGSIQPYRASQCFTIYVAFVLFLVAHTALSYDGAKEARRYAGIAVTAVCMLICLQMASFLNYVFFLNHQRSENESALAYSVGYQLMNEYPHGKRICFVGWGTSGDYIERQLRTDPQSKKGNYYIRIYRRLWHEDPPNLRGIETNVNSVITWSKGTPEMLYQYFAYHGYNLNIVPWTEQAVHQEAIQTAQALGLQPYEIAEQEDYIIVCLPWLNF